MLKTSVQKVGMYVLEPQMYINEVLQDAMELWRVLKALHFLWRVRLPSVPFSVRQIPLVTHNLKMTSLAVVTSVAQRSSLFVRGIFLPIIKPSVIQTIRQRVGRTVPVLKVHVTL
jgi:hypothetical protein